VKILLQLPMTLLVSLSCLFLIGCPCKPNGFLFDGFEGGLGTDMNSLNNPAGMTFRITNKSGEGVLFIADKGNNRVQQWSSDKSSIVSDSGSLPGQLLAPASVAVTQFDVFRGKGLKNGELPPDSELNVYVTDAGNNRIQQFDLSGKLIRTWGKSGSASGEFNSPRGIEVDYSGNVYVVDSKNHRIQVFDSTGILLTSWGETGTGNGQFNIPIDISLGFLPSDELVYVAVSDSGNNRVQFFSPEGTYLTSVGSFPGATGLSSNVSTLAVLTPSDNSLTLVSWPSLARKKFSISQTNGPSDIIGAFDFALRGVATFTISDAENDRISFYAFVDCDRK
jgi:NHL repeat